MRQALGLADDRCGLRGAVREFHGWQVSVLDGPADEASGRAAGRGPLGQPGVHIVLGAFLQAVPACPEVVQEADGHGGGLLGGQEGALLQRPGALEVAHPIQVGPAGVLADQQCVWVGQGAGLGLQPGVEAFDVEVHRLQQLVLDAQGAQEGDLGR